MEKKKRGLFNKVFGFETIKQGAVMTKEMISDVAPNKKNLIKESFGKALKRNGITKSEENQTLLRLYKNQKVQFLVIISGAIFLMYKSISSFLIGSGFSDILSGFSFLTLSFALTSVSLHYAFRCFQIRNKRLGMLKIWLSSPKEWYPRKINKDLLIITDEFQTENKSHSKLTDTEYLKEISDFKLSNLNNNKKV